MLRNQEVKIVSVKMAALPGGYSVKFKMEKEKFEEIANAYEESIARSKNQHPDEPDVTGSTSEVDGANDVVEFEETAEEVPKQSRRLQRKGEGSNYASIISSLLK